MLATKPNMTIVQKKNADPPRTQTPHVAFPEEQAEVVEERKGNRELRQETEEMRQRLYGCPLSTAQVFCTEGRNRSVSCKDLSVNLTEIYVNGRKPYRNFQ